MATLFEKEIKILRKFNKPRITVADAEWTKFRIWTKGFKNGLANEVNFKEYKKVENVNLDFFVEKEIYEKHFGCKFEYDYNQKRWRKVK